MNPQIKLITTTKSIPHLSNKTIEAVLFFSKTDKKSPSLASIGTSSSHKNLFAKLAKEKVISENFSTSYSLYQQKQSGVGEVIFHNLGSLDHLDKKKSSSLFRLENFTDRFRMAGGDLTRQHLQVLAQNPGSDLVIDMSGLQEILQAAGRNGEQSLADLFSAFTEGLYLGTYQYKKFKSASNKSDKREKPIKSFTVILLLPKSKNQPFRQINNVLFNRSKIAAEGVRRARDLVNAPPNDLNSETFVREVKMIATNLNVRCQIFGKSQLKTMKMNALLAVNAGSLHEAKLAVLDNRYSQKGKTILLVGKGVLFDSGGLSLKPSTAMNGMKMDMAGGAAVLAAFEALVKLKIKARVVTIIPLTDNMTGENAMKVGDVIRTRSGKTVEVLNTDAEGRLILCDAINYGIEKYNPDYIVDLATLTGACLVALGTYYAGLFTPGDDLAKKLLDSSRHSDEPLWRLPLDELYLKELQSDIADLKNIGSSYGGAITAAKFLEQFVPEKYQSQWAHLDIAPVMDYSQTKGYQVKGGSGFGVRLLMDFVETVIKKTIS